MNGVPGKISQEASEKSECSSLVLHAVQENTFRRKTEFSLNYGIHFSAKLVRGEGVVVNGKCYGGLLVGLNEWKIRFFENLLREIFCRAV